MRSASTLVGGDLELGATGTVTHIDGDRVYAFGHPMYNLGPTEFPMTRAYVYTVLPSLFSSIEAVDAPARSSARSLQDRATAIAGTLGAGPQLIPITITLESERGAKRTFHFGVVNDQLFTPLMTYVALLNTLGSYERQFGAATFASRGNGDGRRTTTPIAFDNLFSGDSAVDRTPPRTSSAPITALIGNDYEKVDVDGARPHRRRRPRSRRPRRSSACGSTIRGRAPAARCR